MSSWLCFLVAFAAFQSLVTAKGTACGKVPHDLLILTGNRRWYYCQTSESPSYGACFIDVIPDGNEMLALRFTRYNSQAQQLEVKSFNMTETENNSPPEIDARGVEFARTEDKNCMLRMSCPKNSPPHVQFMCREKSGCEGGIHDKFIEEKIGEIKKREGMEELKTQMEESYNKEKCGE